MINQQLIMNRYLDFAHHFYADVIFCDCLYYICRTWLNGIQIKWLYTLYMHLVN